MSSLLASDSKARDHEIKEQTLGGVLWTVGARFVTKALDQLATVVLVRLLAPGDFGLFAMAGLFTTLLHIFADMGLARAVVQRGQIDDEQAYYSTAFWGNLLTGFVLCAIAAASAIPIAAFYRQPDVTLLAAALSVRFIFAGFNATQLAVLYRQMRFATITKRNVVSILSGGAIGIGLAVAGAGVWSLIGQAVSLSLIGTLLLWHASSWRPNRTFSRHQFRDLWRYGSRVLGSRILSTVVKQFDTLVIGRWLGPMLLGYYAFAYTVFFTPIVDISIIIGRVVFPAFSKLQEDVRRLRSGFMLTTRYISFFVFPAVIGLILILPDLIALVFGARWLPAAPVLRILLVAALFHIHLNIWSTVFQAMDRVDWLLWLAVAALVLYAPAFFVGLRWGLVGVAAAYTVATIAMMPIQLALVQRLVGFRMRAYLLTLRPIVLACVVMSVCVLTGRMWLIHRDIDAPLRLVVEVVLGIVSYVLATVLIERSLVNDLRLHLGDVRRPRRTRLAEEVIA